MTAEPIDFHVSRDSGQSWEWCECDDMDESTETDPIPTGLVARIVSAIRYLVGE